MLTVLLGQASCLAGLSDTHPYAGLFIQHGLAWQIIATGWAIHSETLSRHVYVITCCALLLSVSMALGRQQGRVGGSQHTVKKAGHFDELHWRFYNAHTYMLMNNDCNLFEEYRDRLNADSMHTCCSSVMSCCWCLQHNAAADLIVEQCE